MTEAWPRCGRLARRTMIVTLSAAALSLALVPAARAACDLDRPACHAHAGLRLNDIQAVGSHNSYKRRIPPPELAMIRAHSAKEAISLDYWHGPLERQLDLGLRQLEIDVVYDPKGGRYAHPRLPVLAAGMPGDTAYDARGMDVPGFKVFHIPDVDVRSQCALFVACLKRIRAWSDAHPDHVPIMILMNAKDGKASLPGGVAPLPFDAAAFDALDAEIRSVLPPSKLITPDTVRGNARTLRQAALAGGWPSLKAARGKIFFVLDESPKKVGIYMRGHASLQGLVAFVNSIDEGADHAAYFTLNDPIGQKDRIRADVAAGFLVRTRADSGTREARTNDTRRRAAAFASGAQYVSTDYESPRVDFGPYRVGLPGGGVARCNPVRRDAACRVRPRAPADVDVGRHWLAGDHHVHSRFSGRFETRRGRAPIYMLGADGRYPIPLNAEKAQQFGLAWMVATDHGGVGLSRLRYEQAYPELERSRRDVPDVIQFYGMEFDTPGGDHSSLIMPISSHERTDLRGIEAKYAKHEVMSGDKTRNTTALMLQALGAMERLKPRPIVIANHPSRAAKAAGQPGGHTLAEMQAWNDAAPDVAVGMEGAPGHQAAALAHGVDRAHLRGRGDYDGAPTLGGFDPMTATLGGDWDRLLGEGRHWWITANSDSHRNFADGGNDFWPGQYSKTYVFARRDSADILDGLRHGRIFVVTGDLVSELDVNASVGTASAGIGGTLQVPQGAPVQVSIRVRDPGGANFAGRHPQVRRIDVILGNVKDGRGPHARVIRRFAARDWTRRGEVLTVRLTLPPLKGDVYLRVRGTNTGEAEPRPDVVGENPWDDLWFYSNPVFLVRRGCASASTPAKESQPCP